MTARTLVRTLFVLVPLALAAPAAAQWHGPHGGGRCAPHAPMTAADAAQHWQMRAQHLAQRLQLNASQQQQLQAIVQAELARWQQTVGATQPRTPERMAARRAMMQDFDARFSPILNAQQRAQWDQMKAHMQQRFEHRQEREHDERFGI